MFKYIEAAESNEVSQWLPKGSLHWQGVVFGFLFSELTFFGREDSQEGGVAVRRIFSSLGSLLGIVALIVFVIALAFIFRSRSGEEVAWQPPTAPTPVPSIKNVRMSDTPGGPAVVNFPSGTSSVYLIFEYAQVQDAPIRVMMYDNVGNVLFERTKNYSGAGVETIGMVSRAAAFADGRYVTNVYVGSELFVVKTLMWVVGEELPTPTPTVRPTTVPTPTVVPPTPPMPPTPAAMETYISKTLITANVGDGPGEMGIFFAPEVRPVVPTAIALDGEGNIYIFDAVNRRVVKYDSEGNFVSSIMPSLPIGSAKDMCIGDSGAIYLLEGGGLFARQYNQKGELVLEYPKPDWVVYFRSISLDNEGNLLAQVAELNVKGDFPSNHVVVPIGDAQQVFSGQRQLDDALAGYLLGDIVFAQGRMSDDGTEMQLFDQYGNLIKRLGPFDPKMVTFDTEADGSGNLYFLRCVMTERTPFEVSKFNRNGSLIARFLVPAPYVPPARQIAVDDAQNVYYLLPLKDEVQVIKWEKQ